MNATANSQLRPSLLEASAMPTADTVNPTTPLYEWTILPSSSRSGGATSADKSKRPSAGDNSTLSILYY